MSDRAHGSGTALNQMLVRRHSSVGRWRMWMEWVGRHDPPPTL